MALILQSSFTHALSTDKEKHCGLMGACLEHHLQQPPAKSAMYRNHEMWTASIFLKGLDFFGYETCEVQQSETFSFNTGREFCILCVCPTLSQGSRVPPEEGLPSLANLMRAGVHLTQY